MLRHFFMVKFMVRYTYRLSGIMDIAEQFDRRGKGFQADQANLIAHSLVPAQHRLALDKIPKPGQMDNKCLAHTPSYPILNCLTIWSI